MSQSAGTIKAGELWLRCPDCGDSQRSSTKAHMSINLRKGVYHCVRCGYSGSLSTKQMFDLSMRFDLSVGGESRPTLDLLPLSDGTPTQRFSALKRWHYEDQVGDVWDVFNIRDPRHNEEVGQYFRLDQQSIIRGESGLGWVGGPLTSSPSSPLRLVEGPYDVLGPQDVCCYGFLRTRVLKSLKGHFVLLCPDGDVWQDQMLRDKIINLLNWALKDRKAPEIVGLEMIPGGLDPDECHPADRLYVNRNSLLQRIVTPRRSMDIARYCL